jgi:hypothetical protein
MGSFWQQEPRARLAKVARENPIFDCGVKQGELLAGQAL